MLFSSKVDNSSLRSPAGGTGGQAVVLLGAWNLWRSSLSGLAVSQASCHSCCQNSAKQTRVLLSPHLLQLHFQGTCNCTEQIGQRNCNKATQKPKSRWASTRHRGGASRGSFPETSLGLQSKLQSRTYSVVSAGAASFQLAQRCFSCSRTPQTCRLFMGPTTAAATKLQALLGWQEPGHIHLQLGSCKKAASTKDFFYHAAWAP